MGILYKVQTKQGSKEVGSLWEVLRYMAEGLKVPIAINNHETGLSMSLLALAEGEIMTTEDGSGNTITITRLKKEK